MTSWIYYALLSAAAAGATAILAKVGVQGVPSNLATAVRTVVVLVFAWGIVLARGEDDRRLPGARVEFFVRTLDGNGAIRDAQVAAGSGHPLLDDAAVRAAFAMGSLPEAGAREVILPVVFRLR